MCRDIRTQHPTSSRASWRPCASVVTARPQSYRPEASRSAAPAVVSASVAIPSALHGAGLLCVLAMLLGRHSSERLPAPSDDRLAMPAALAPRDRDRVMLSTRLVDPDEAMARSVPSPILDNPLNPLRNSRHDQQISSLWARSHAARSTAPSHRDDCRGWCYRDCPSGRRCVTVASYSSASRAAISDRWHASGSASTQRSAVVPWVGIVATIGSRST